MLKDCHPGSVNCFAARTLLPVKGENVFTAEPGRAIARSSIYRLEYKALGEAQRWRQIHLPRPPVPPLEVV